MVKPRGCKPPVLGCGSSTLPLSTMLVYPNLAEESGLDPVQSGFESLGEHYGPLSQSGRGSGLKSRKV